MQDSHQNIVEILGRHPVTRGLSAEARAAIATVSSAVAVRPGEAIVEEGEEEADLYLLVKGDAVAVRGAADGEPVELNPIHEGDCIGELTFLEGGSRSTSVRAESDCDLIHIPAAALKQARDSLPVMGELKGALASVVVQRARAMSDDMLSSLRRELEANKLRNQFGHFLLFTISIFLISTMLFYLVAEKYVKDVYDPGFSWQTVFFLAVPSLLIIKFMKIPLSDLGIKREGFGRSLRESLAICAVVTLPVAIYLFAFKETTPAAGLGIRVDSFFLIQYLAHTIVQEIGSRGLLQGLFQKFLNDRKGHRAVFMTSTVFASLHITFGIDAVMITFVASVVFGYVYLRQKNLIGVTVLHYWLGVLAAVAVAF
ncbi:cyclic nucleotide-binding domain-containing protein [Rhodovibrionaceae bacterium A322]